MSDVRVIVPAGYKLIHPEAKAFGLTTEAQKAVYWRSFERMRTRWYGAYARMTAKQFRAEQEAVMKVIKGVEPSGMESAIRQAMKGQADEWSKFFKTSYLAIGEDFAPMVVRSFGKAAPAFESKAEDPWMKLLLNWISKQSGAKVTQIQGTTLDRLRAQLSEGMEAGESMEDISKRLSGIYDDGISTRSTIIARTEVISASNAASYAGAKSTDLRLKKQWLSSRDARVRETHNDADGQEVGMDEPFNVGGYDLMFPGDSSLGAPASEIVSCRCTQTYSRA
ncbi:MAG: phage minor head protein [Methanomassiliicoccales archaeon]|jgi:uncharacterized protein with gpF-like domain